MSLETVRGAAGRLLSRLREIEAGGAGAELLPELTAAMGDCLAELSGLGLWGRENELPSSELWNLAGDLLSRGWMQHRARTKPRGYAGDFELLGRIVRDQLCEDPLGRLFDRYFQDLAAPRAVQNRTRLVGEWIVERISSASGPQQVVVVGSGPAYDVEFAAKALAPVDRSRLKVRLLDYDPQSLEDAEARLAGLLPAENLEFQAGGLFRIPDRPKLAAMLDGADLLVSVGMFDYLDDQQSARMLTEFWQRTNAGGEVVVFNFSPRNTSRAYMEWIGNWYLIYRDESAMRRMAADAGISPESYELGSEELGVDLFLRCRKG